MKNQPVFSILISMAYAALIPFLVLFSCFTFFRITLTQASFIALLVCTVISQTLFHSTDTVWNASLLNTFEFLVEIGLILLGAFFFIEVAQKNKVMDSLASLIREISPNRIVQGILVTFPMELMVEGSSGFGTPLLIIAPLLLSLHFPIELCATLPFINMAIGIPFGALGTPLRLGFPQGELTYATTLLMIPFAFIGPLLNFYLIQKLDPQKHKHTLPTFKIIIWITIMSITYSGFSLWISHYGPEFPTLCSALLTFIVGIMSARFLFHFQKQIPLKNKLGISIYALLLFSLWLGKKLWMDELIPGTHIRKFNPGIIFILFGLGIGLTFKKAPIVEMIQNTLNRSKRTFFVFFCMTFMVQQIRNNGALLLLTANIPSFFLQDGIPILGWLGSAFIGTSTMTNLLFSKIIDPHLAQGLASGSAFGVQMAFQSFSAMRSILNDHISENKIIRFILPISAGFVLLLLIYVKILAIFFELR